MLEASYSRGDPVMNLYVKLRIFALSLGVAVRSQSNVIVNVNCKIQYQYN